MLDATVRELKKAFPKVQLRKVLTFPRIATPLAHMSHHSFMHWAHWTAGCGAGHTNSNRYSYM